MAAPSLSSTSSMSSVSPVSPVSYPSALPAFLRQNIHAKFVDLEWQQRERLLQGTQRPSDPNDPPSQWSRLAGDAITARNRYLNVEPYAQNRIRLKVEEGMNDYINASPIQLGKRKYIATQGPKETSVNHFYHMLAFEVQSPAVVVMLTQTHEAGREKCFQYYPLSAEESPLIVPPDNGTEDGFKGEVVLESVEEHASSRSQIRRLRLRVSVDEAQGTSEMEIIHLLFSGWPDFLIPEGEDRTALLELIRLSTSLNGPHSGARDSLQLNGSSSAGKDTPAMNQENPRIIHCSAGVGRSGTFIALDYLLSLLHSDKLDDVAQDKDPVAETVDQLRQQRMMMVQGESQFHFLYEVLREQMIARMEQRNSGLEVGKM